jgi:Tfp pilus assembly protein PilN
MSDADLIARIAAVAERQEETERKLAEIQKAGEKRDRELAETRWRLQGLQADNQQLRALVGRLAETEPGEEWITILE